MRWPHWIKENSRCETPSHVITVALVTSCDTDSNSQPHYALVSGYCVIGHRDRSTRQWSHKSLYFTSAQSFWNIITDECKPKTRTYIILEDSWLSSNLLECFTLPVNLAWTTTFAVIDCPPFIVRMRRGKATINILDKCNIWPTPSSDISTTENARRGGNVNDAVERYVRQLHAQDRAQQTYHDITEWLDFLVAEDMGGFSATIGAQSFRTWRHKFMHDKIFIDLHDDALSLARRALYGGRCECFHIGKIEGQCWQLDINSAYPAAMHSLRVPTRLIGHTHYGSIEDLSNWIDSKVCVAEVQCYTLKPYIPCRTEVGLCFPTGSFWTVLAGDELMYALRRGAIVDVHQLAIYEYKYAFKSYMEYLWNARMSCESAGDTKNAHKYKLLMNSFFGKWAQKGTYWEKVADANDETLRKWTEVTYDTQEVREFRQFSGIVQERQREHESYESSPAIAACITAAARVWLWQYIEMAGRENVYYTDTDSLFVDYVGYRRLHQCIDRRELGGLQVKGVYDSIEIYGCRDLVAGSARIHAGVRETAMDDGRGHVLQDDRVSLSTQISAGHWSPGEHRKIAKNFLRTYKKGVVQDDGRVIPLYL